MSGADLVVILGVVYLVHTLVFFRRVTSGGRDRRHRTRRTYAAQVLNGAWHALTNGFHLR
jgi:hypothetical protein